MGSIMRKFSKPWIVITTLFLVKCLSLRNVRLTIEPKVVRRLGKSTLHCSYDLEDDELLYSVKWYRGSFEFYRYTPSETHRTKIFLVSGINVDLDHSNSTQVTLTEIDFPLSGKFSCEVTTEAPFSTGTDTQTMQVVKLPDFPPKISVGRDPLDYGDVLRANCSSSPSKPQPTLTFVLNNHTVGRSEPSPSSPNHHEVQKSLWSDLTLEMKLHEFHFNDGRKLVLQCIAEIPDLYYEKAVLKLVSARDPVPERDYGWQLLNNCYTFKWFEGDELPECVGDVFLETPVNEVTQVSAANNVGFVTWHTTLRIVLLCNVIYHLPR